MKTDVLSLIHNPEYAEAVLSALTDDELGQIENKLLKALNDPRVEMLWHLLSPLKVLLDAEQAARVEIRK